MEEEITAVLNFSTLSADTETWRKFTTDNTGIRALIKQCDARNKLDPNSFTDNELCINAYNTMRYLLT